MSSQHLWVASALALLVPAAHADMSFSLSSTPVAAPVSLAFFNSTTAGTLATGTASGPYNFLDQWTFTLAENAEVSWFVGSLNFTGQQGQVVQGIDFLQLRLVGPSPSGTALVVGWKSATQFSGFQTLFSVASPTAFAPGTYALEVRGQLLGTASAYAGTLQATSAVPLPPAMPGLAVGLVALACLGWRRQGRQRAAV